jgi:hypothetical protein
MIQSMVEKDRVLDKFPLHVCSRNEMQLVQCQGIPDSWNEKNKKEYGTFGATVIKDLVWVDNT